MQHETQTGRFDPCVNSHRPASGKSQDISHVLANTFKDLYTKDVIGKDTLSNLIKTKNGRSSYHDKYIEELQLVHSEYNQCIKEADMLENHIILARARAAATENQAYERMKAEIGVNDVSDYQGLLTVKSNPAKQTIAYAMHVSREPQDDGYTLITRSEKAERSESHPCLTFDSSSYTSKRKTTPGEKANQTKARPKWNGEPSAKDRADGLELLQKLKDRHSFLRNPRFLPPNAQQGGTSLIQLRPKVVKTEQEGNKMVEQSSIDDPVPIFLAQPSVVIFTDYSVGHVYETTLELKNLTSSSRHVRVIPPTTPYFSIGLGRFPGEGGVVAPGMGCKYIVRFAPDSLADYEDFIVVETQTEHLFVVPIIAQRPPPILTIPRVLDCGYCLIGGVKFVEFLCQNVGLSTGTFCIIPKNQWPASSLRSASRTCFSEQPPFAVSPSLFMLQPGEATVVEVVFFPTTAEKSCQAFTVVCDNCQVKDILIEGEGQLIALELVSVSGEILPPVIGEVRDLTAEHFVRFRPCNPHSVQQKKIIIRNNVHLELPFHWQIMKPNLHPLLPGETLEPSHIQFHLATDDVFRVSPVTGFLAPCQDHEFIFTWYPKEIVDYHSVYHLVLRDVPQMPPDPSEKSILQPVRTGSKVNDVISMEIEVKGSTVPYQVLLEPYAIVIPAEIFICTTTRRQFKMWNHSKTFIFFQWDRKTSQSCVIEVEPSTGRIEENECFDFDLIVTGVKPERVVTSLVCHIEHHHEPVTLVVEVSFKGPIVNLNVPGVDFGLMRLGEQSQTTLLLNNCTQLEASWTLEEKVKGQQDNEDTQILIQPCRGVLPPSGSCSVNVLFRPRFCQICETELELMVENGTGCHLSVRADVQSPKVCLLNCQLLLSEPYVGIPARGTVTLFNQTLLPSHFRWMAQLQGTQASQCTASFDPSSGTLAPKASMEITVNFTSHTNVEVTDMAALCEVQGMDSPLVLSILASKPKKLSVSYSLPSDCSALDDERSLVLNFGDDVVLKRPVTRQLLITNQTAVTAPFTINAEYFTCHPAKPNNQSEKRFTYVKKPLHSVQAKKVEEKAHEDIRMDWETYNVDQNDRKLVDVVVAYGDAFPVKDADGNEVIPAKSSGTIYVSFTPLTLSGSACESRCVGLALGFLSLDSEVAVCVPSKVTRAQGLDLEPVRVDLLAAVKPAVLLVQMEDDDGVLEFHASAGDLLKAQSLKEVVVQEFDITQSLRLKNTLEVPLHFRLGTQPPFIVLKPQLRAQTSTSTSPPSGDSSSLVLPPQHSMQVKVAFHCSLSLLDHVDRTDEDGPPGVMLIHGANGHRKLRFQQDLLIHYSNNSLQTVPLRAHLDLATLGLSRDSVNFGFCYVGQTQTVEVNLYSHGAQTYWKSIIESNEGDSHVFSVTPDFGLLRFKELSVSSCSKSLQIRFTPSEDREFRAMVVIQCALEKTPITLQLQGTGSFDEMYRSN
ncbi:Deleted in lung and esophageal cancer protein 1 Deleted in lung cancer protein 1 [Channa argus]|uniref:Deleted in lung and esophageal cancer protein 1 Deleted in lung cancer protein 1 n=1 Tax=Channa argus TaxID=215402 RepID=A0A6G1QMN8_CHAAH|nr:Deleted in lung and esophageal cancer protein 1 Deleted in lung cancer protein 1 [Channa argus]